MYEEKAKRLGIEQKSLNISNESALASVKAAVETFKSYGIKAECIDLDTTRHKAVFTQRVYDIQNAIRTSDHSLSFEVSNLKTDFYKKNGFNEPSYLHRAKRLEYVLKNKSVIVHPGELLVGNYTEKRRGAQVWEEHYGPSGFNHPPDSQTDPVSFQCSTKDKLTFYFKIFPSG
jgi:hypothetical protein